MTQNTTQTDEAVGAPEVGNSRLIDTLEAEEEERLEKEWSLLGKYDNGDNGCPNCGRHRLILCPNGKHRCEKCNWCPELNEYAPVRSF